MRELSDPARVREAVRLARCRGEAVGLVPTMGFLHAGHTRLMEMARAENELVVASIFVNPTQFSLNEDLDRYPRDLNHDRLLAEQSGVNVLFVPELETMYPGGSTEQAIWIDPGSLADHLDGASRPGHFRGVATVVAKLFHMVEPDRAYFGQKDAQQAIVISRMVSDLGFPVDIRVAPTVREPDGLALSSRNVYLSSAERADATALRTALDTAMRLLIDGERDSGRLRQAMRESIEGTTRLAKIDFIDVADLRSLNPIEGPIKSDSLIALAVYIGRTRLIDNVIVRFHGDAPAFS